MNEYQYDTPPTDEVILFDVTAEKAVLASLILDSGAIAEINGIVRPMDFYNSQNRSIYQAMIDLYDRNDPIDMITVLSELGAVADNGTERNTVDADVTSYVIGLGALDGFNSFHIEAYATTVHELSVRRQMQKVSQRMVRAAYDLSQPVESVLADAEHALHDVTGNAGSNASTSATIADNWIERYLEKEARPFGEITGLETGLIDYDRIFDGLHSGNVYVMAGRPKMGKTMIACQQAIHIANNGGNVLFFSTEMNESQLMNRFVSNVAKVSHNQLRRARLDEQGKKAAMNAARKIGGMSLTIDTTSTTASQMKSVAIREHARQPIDVVFIDHLHEMSYDGRKQLPPRLELREMCKMIRDGIAKRLDVPVVLLAQLSRKVEDRQDKRPVASDLRESGAIEEIAYGVTFVYRPSVYDEMAGDKTELITRMNRDGETGTANLIFIPEHSRFGAAEVVKL